MNEKTYVEIQGFDYYFNFDKEQCYGDKRYRVGLYRILVNGDLAEIVVKTGDTVHQTFTCFQLGLATLYYEGFVAAIKHLDLV